MATPPPSVFESPDYFTLIHPVDSTFYEGKFDPRPVAKAPPSSNSSLAVLGIEWASFAVLFVVILCVIVWCRRKSRRVADESRLVADDCLVLEDGFGPSVINKTKFTVKDLAKATDGFAQSNLIGKGGFGDVFRGTLRNGQTVAVKQLKPGSAQGEPEFQAELAVISQVHHRNLVSLVGYCTSDRDRVLVYEFVPNGTLEAHLHGKDVLNWERRMKIAVGSANGLAYLHESCQPRIIHRDVKSANILLDSNFLPKIADFGLARHIPDAATHVSTRVMGTFGYMAPEYALCGQLTDKADVFSFGVLLLEIITCLCPVNEAQFVDKNIIDWAKPLMSQALKDGDFSKLADARLATFDATEMTRMVTCASVCVRHLARRRPSMSQVVRALEGHLPLPGLSEGSSTAESLDFDSDIYRDELNVFRAMILMSGSDSDC